MNRTYRHLSAAERRAAFWLDREADWQAFLARVARWLGTDAAEVKRFLWWLALLFIASTTAFYVYGAARIIAETPVR